MRTTGKFPAQKMPRSMAGTGAGRAYLTLKTTRSSQLSAFGHLTTNNLHGTHLPVQTVYAIVCRFWAKCHICVSARVSTTTPLPSLQESRAAGFGEFIADPQRELRREG